jgi:hypothetical protein
MVQNIKYRSYYEIDSEKPHIELGFKFKDYFETCNYYLISESNNFKSVDNIKFQILKNEDELGEIILENLDVDQFLEKFSNITSDHDFKKMMISEHKNHVKKDLLSFFEKYRKTILENKFTLEGEILRMRKVAGII